MNGIVVVDASLAFKWLVREEHTDKALAILRSWESQGIVPTAPHLMPAEVTNALHRRVVRGEMSSTVAANLIKNLLSSSLELREALELHGRALELAHELHICGYIIVLPFQPSTGPSMHTI